MTLNFGLTTLRWLLRRGSPLPIPNRVVKPACADGTAVLWESMSSPFFSKTLSNSDRVFLFCMFFCFLTKMKKQVLRSSTQYQSLLSGKFNLFLYCMTCNYCVPAVETTGSILKLRIGRFEKRYYERIRIEVIFLLFFSLKKSKIQRIVRPEGKHPNH